MSRVGILIVATALMSSVGYSQQSVRRGATDREKPVFRPAFTLRLQVDDRHSYEQQFDRVPYVSENEVYIFAGETFGIDVRMAGDQIAAVSYRADPVRADVEFAFRQERSPDGPMMLLIIRNKLRKKLRLDGLMTVPGEKGVYNTNLLPVEPGLSNFESWPHPIVQLVLRNFRFSEKAPEPSGGRRPAAK
jgi:hypothetical protein